VRKVTFEFVERERSRTEEFVLTWASQTGSAPHFIVRQQWTFTPSGSTTESETYELEGVQELALRIKPDLSDPTAIATLAAWRNRAMPISTLLIIVLLIVLIGALPTLPHSRSWGYYPKGVWD
jgi:Protein of unknown function (DUF3309)